MTTETSPDLANGAPTADPTRSDVSISASAAGRIKALMEAEKNPDLMLRVMVSGGGCSGFSYGFDLEKTTAEEDRVFQEHGVTVVIDEASLELLRGSVIDYTEDLMAAAFTIKNPNATSTCGCGTSFSV
ncbi:MAG: iron-sulfur cluster insertion protein ErpA [Rhodospirillum sp.]|nr:iron-sulfur cluster insertion protein ErpA [Rhodospirillum sp.]MCF8490318.1 iron-sulfur cluster insertion protein ErpA [Rhodospirillum sp.]MCF8500158.1 iron-sulfur cluster insertion protein ErpA [Rhodospirillum sp.]